MWETVAQPDGRTENQRSRGLEFNSLSGNVQSRLEPWASSYLSLPLCVIVKKGRCQSIKLHESRDFHTAVQLTLTVPVTTIDAL